MARVWHYPMGEWDEGDVAALIEDTYVFGGIVQKMKEEDMSVFESEYPPFKKGVYSILADELMT